VTGLWFVQMVWSFHT